LFGWLTRSAGPSAIVSSPTGWRSCWTASSGAVAVPETLALRDAGVLGIAGTPEQRQALARWLVVQAATLHSPADLSVVLLSTSGLEPWLPVRWLPHARPAFGECFALVGGDQETVAARVGELAAVLDQRLADAPRDGRHGLQEVVVVLDGAQALRRQRLMAELLREGPRVGIYAICLEDTRLRLPEECRAVCVFDGAARPIVTVERGAVGATSGVVADQPPAQWAERVARALAPIRDVSGRDGTAGIPTEVRLLDLLGCPDPTAQAITERWAAGVHSPRATIGVAKGGPFTVDLRRDGPHALVAGTTGSGKSELLKTLVTALAIANRPDELNFVLVDYKGGAAFQGCEGLPHVVGMMTDLEPQTTQRALVSLTAELTRREAALDRARRATPGGAEIQDAYGYWAARDRGAACTEDPMPRLLLVIDEFAHVVSGENLLNDFIHGLIGIAQRGRALGVHLVLATQRPGGGVVSPEIRANVNLRIALRVVNDAESTDVIDAVDAARISPSVPGRAFAHLGEARPVEFQAALVGASRGAGADAEPWLRVLSADGLGRAVRPHADGSRPSEPAATNLAVAVRAMREAAEQMGLAAPRRPPALRRQPTLRSLDGAADDRGRHWRAVPSRRRPPLRARLREQRRAAAAH
jgi:S-DNA-T family DNA segregation ATPase FtsK/SpoIIIE